MERLREILSEKREAKATKKNSTHSLTSAEILAQDFSQLPPSKLKLPHPHATIDEIIQGLDEESMKRSLVDVNKRLAQKPDAWYQFWTNGVVPYEFGSDFWAKDDVYSAMKEIMSKTCIKFEPYENVPTAPDRIRLVTGTGCSSWVSMVKGWASQDVTLADGCIYPGIIKHELMHALGLHHTQTQYNRENYVKVHYENIQDGLAFAFNAKLKSESFGVDLPYDYMSIMHYGPHFFSKNGEKTITALNGASCYEDYMGDPFAKLSFIDAKILNMMYKCGDSCPYNPSCSGECFQAKIGNSGCSCICPKTDPCGGKLSLGSVTPIGAVTDTPPTDTPSTTPQTTITPSTTRPTTSNECYTGDGSSYRGTANKAQSGQTCVDWSIHSSLGYSGESLVSNYCRNPDNDSKPWCFVNKDADWDYCALPSC